MHVYVFLINSVHWSQHVLSLLQAKTLLIGSVVNWALLSNAITIQHMKDEAPIKGYIREELVEPNSICQLNILAYFFVKLSLLCNFKVGLLQWNFDEITSSYLHVLFFVLSGLGLFEYDPEANGKVNLWAPDHGEQYGAHHNVLKSAAINLALIWQIQPILRSNESYMTRTHSRSTIIPGKVKWAHIYLLTLTNLRKYTRLCQEPFWKIQWLVTDFTSPNFAFS